MNAIYELLDLFEDSLDSRVGSAGRVSSVRGVSSRDGEGVDYRVRCRILGDKLNWM